MTSRLHMESDQPDFIRRQYEFAANIRDPEKEPAPADIEERRMAVYRELFYNNVESFISGTFPVLRKLHRDESWHALIRDYFARHRSRTPLFPEMPREFVAYLESERGDHPGDFPFLYELAHYEWVELALSIAEETIPTDGVEPDGNLLDAIPVLSPLAWHLNYRFPVHRISPDFIPSEPGENPTSLVVYRNREDEVGFLEINPVTKRLLELLGEETGRNGRSLLQQIAGELKHPQPEVVIDGGHQILTRLHELDIVPGTRL